MELLALRLAMVAGWDRRAGWGGFCRAIVMRVMKSEKFGLMFRKVGAPDFRKKRERKGRGRTAPRTNGDIDWSFCYTCYVATHLSTKALSGEPFVSTHLWV